MRLNIPFYPQSTEFTCDPACLMMALKYFNFLNFSRELEFDIWREAYGIGIPGCMPQGLAFSALARGLKVSLICKRENIIQISEKLAKGEDREIALFTSKKLFEKTKEMNVIDKNPELKDIEEALLSNKIPLVMMHMDLLHKIDSPHWVVVTGFDKKNVWINDPYNKNGKDVLVKKNKFLEMMNDLEKYSEIGKRMLVVWK